MRHANKKMLTGFFILMGLLAAVALRDVPLRSTTEPPAETTIPDAPPYQYLLREERQCLGLYLAEQGQWEKIADIDVTLEDLPETDREILGTGIVLRDAEELQRTLEDYLPMG